MISASKPSSRKKPRSRATKRGMTVALREATPIRRGVSFPGFSAEKTFSASIGMRIRESKRIVIRPMVPSGFFLFALTEIHPLPKANDRNFLLRDQPPTCLPSHRQGTQNSPQSAPRGRRSKASSGDEREQTDGQPLFWGESIR